MRLKNVRGANEIIIKGNCDEIFSTEKAYKKKFGFSPKRKI